MQGSLMDVFLIVPESSKGKEPLCQNIKQDIEVLFHPGPVFNIKSTVTDSVCVSICLSICSCNQGLHCWCSCKEQECRRNANVKAFWFHVRITHFLSLHSEQTPLNIQRHKIISFTTHLWESLCIRKTSIVIIGLIWMKSSQNLYITRTP